MPDVLWVCAGCGSQWAPGAPCCPECRAKTHQEVPAAMLQPVTFDDEPQTGIGDEDPFGSHAGDEDGIPEPEAAEPAVLPLRLPPPAPGG